MGILLFTSPVQHDNSEHVLHIARELRSAGNDVSVFLLGDGVYNASSRLVSEKVETVVSRMKEENIPLIACSTSSAYRGVECVTDNAKLGTLEDLVDMVVDCDIMLNFTSEG